MYRVLTPGQSFHKYYNSYLIRIKAGKICLDVSTTCKTIRMVKEEMQLKSRVKGVLDRRRIKRHLRVIKNTIAERRKGLDFSMMSLTDNHYPKNKKSNYYGYFMTLEDTLRNGLNRLHINPEELSFIDVGCGKGLCLKVASEYGFKKVGGIEFLHDLAETAKNNMRILGLPAEVFEENAIYFDKYADYDVFYFYNPFDSTIFKPVIAAINESLRTRSRKIYVIYTSPVSHQLWIDAGFKYIDKYTDQNRGTQVNIYEK